MAVRPLPSSGGRNRHSDTKLNASDRVAELILKTEHSIAQGGWQAENPRTGKLEVRNIGLPFAMWLEALPYCAGVLRKSGKAKDLDDADILELKVRES